MVPPIATYGAGNVMLPEDVQSKCLVPFIMSVLYAVTSPESAAREYDTFKKGCEEVRNRFRAQYKDQPARNFGSGA